MRVELERVGEVNVPRRSLGGNTTPSGGLLICSIGAKASATGGGTTAGDMVNLLLSKLKTLEWEKC